MDLPESPGSLGKRDTFCYVSKLYFVTDYTFPSLNIRPVKVRSGERTRHGRIWARELVRRSLTLGVSGVDILPFTNLELPTKLLIVLVVIFF